MAKSKKGNKKKSTKFPIINFTEDDVRSILAMLEDSSPDDSMQEGMPEMAYGGIPSFNPSDSGTSVGTGFGTTMGKAASPERNNFGNPTRIKMPEEDIQANLSRIAAADAEATGGFGDILQVLGGMAVSVGSDMLMGGIGDLVGGVGGKGKAVSKGIDANKAAMQAAIEALKPAAYGTNKLGTAVEVEGDEVLALDDGSAIEFKGPSHEQGGMPMLIEDGEVMSNRIKIDDNTLAERAKKRADKIAKLESLLKENPTDALTKNTLERLSGAYDDAGNKDSIIQEFVRNSMAPEEEQPMSGMSLEEMPTEEIPIEEEMPLAAYGFADPPSSTAKQFEDVVVEDPFENREGGEDAVSKKDSWVKTLLDQATGGATVGDLMGIFGNLKSVLDTKKIVDENFANTPVNKNHYENVGKEAKRRLSEAEILARQTADQSVKAVGEHSATSAKNARNTARGVNTLRALDLASQTQANSVISQIYANLAEQLLGIKGQESNLDMQISSAKATGAEKADIANRQDMDAYYTNKLQAQQGMGKWWAMTGATLNQLKKNKVDEKLVNQYSKYLDVNFKTGKISAKDFNLLTNQDVSKITKSEGFKNFDKEGYKKANISKEEWDKLDNENKVAHYGMYLRGK